VVVTPPLPQSQVTTRHQPTVRRTCNCGFTAGFATAVCWMKAQGITTGTNPPKAPCTHRLRSSTGARWSCFLWRAADEPPAPMTLTYDATAGPGTSVEFALTGPLDVIIDWGDNPTTERTSAESTRVDFDHTYTNPGTCNVIITGGARGFGCHVGYNSDAKNRLVAVTSWGQLGLQTLMGAFTDLTGVQQVPRSLPATVTATNLMFYRAVFNQPIGNWNVSSVTTMERMFRDASLFNQDLSGWATRGRPVRNSLFSTGAASWVLPQPNFDVC